MSSRGTGTAPLALPTQAVHPSRDGASRPRVATSGAFAVPMPAPLGTLDYAALPRLVPPTASVPVRPGQPELPVQQPEARSGPEAIGETPQALAAAGPSSCRPGAGGGACDRASIEQLEPHGPGAPAAQCDSPGQQPSKHHRGEHQGGAHGPRFGWSGEVTAYADSDAAAAAPQRDSVQ